ncbi:MAG: hypothetical protein AAF515_05720 [Pseudomonadota bacterium]
MEESPVPELDSLVPAPGEFDIVGALTEAERRERKLRYAAHIRACLLHLAGQLLPGPTGPQLPEEIAAADTRAALEWLREEADSVVGEHTLKREGESLTAAGTLRAETLNALLRALGSPAVGPAAPFDAPTNLSTDAPLDSQTTTTPDLGALIHEIAMLTAQLGGDSVGAGAAAPDLSTADTQRRALIEIRERLATLVRLRSRPTGADGVALLAAELSRLHPDNPVFLALARGEPAPD